MNMSSSKVLEESAAEKEAEKPLDVVSVDVSQADVSQADVSQAQPDEPVGANEFIEYADFAKVELRTALVIEAEKVPKADKLLRLQVDLGSEKRQILAGIAQQYSPEEMVGKTVVIVANLAPRKLRGFESQGMLLAASVSDDAPAGALLTLDQPLEKGAYVR